MKKIVTLLLFVVLISNLHAAFHQIYLGDNKKIYIDNLQWQRVNQEITDYLKNIILNSDKESSEKAKKIFQRIKYERFIPIVYKNNINIFFQDSDIQNIKTTALLFETIQNILLTSSLEIDRNNDSFSIVRNFISNNPLQYKIKLCYSEVSDGKWIETKNIIMKSELNNVLMITSYSALIRSNKRIEFVLNISGKRYELCENNEGSNFNLDFLTGRS